MDRQIINGMTNNIILLLIFHFIGDFLLQNTWMATNKHKDLNALTIHCSIYSLAFLYFGPYFCMVTYMLHFCVDFFTSKLSHYLWHSHRIRRFFVLIGADQTIHLITLVLTLEYLT